MNLDLSLIRWRSLVVGEELWSHFDLDRTKNNTLDRNTKVCLSNLWTTLSQQEDLTRWMLNTTLKGQQNWPELGRSLKEQFLNSYT